MSDIGAFLIGLIVGFGVVFGLLTVGAWGLRRRRRRSFRAKQHRLNNAAMDADEAIEREMEAHGDL